jgi:hypothetical protein
MTPGRFLRWTSDGAYHVHTDEEAAREDCWKRGGECNACPHNMDFAIDADVTEPTSAERPKAKEEAPHG